MSPQGIWSEFG
uniref:Uncharacterized protein n=2 Tax=gambiae species complex TaxID=44542 RepID=A0A182XRT6_ANOQN